MEVKCPKCRYRYDTPVASGENEVACVCPRCGVPFTFSVSVEYKLQEGGEVASNAEKMPSGEPKSATANAKGQQPQESSSDQRRERPSGAYPPTFVPSINGRNARNPFSFDRRSQPSNHGCLRNCLLVFIVTFIVAVFIVRNCFEDRSYTQESLQNGNTEEMVTEEVAKSRGEKPPMWLEGTWRVETDHGVVVVTIYGNRIVELFDGEESRGTFVYRRSKSRLDCDFGDGIPVVYHVDRKRRQLLYDNHPMVKQ